MRRFIPIFAVKDDVPVPLEQDLRATGITMHLAEVKSPVMDRLMLNCHDSGNSQ